MTAGVRETIGNGRFELAELLKGAADVQTFAGLDREPPGPGAGPTEVIVKVMAPSAVSTAQRLRLEHEAEVLRGLSRAGDPLLLDSGFEAGSFYLVQPRHPGTSLRDRLRGGPLDLRTTLQIASCVLPALEAAHDRGVTHRDVKPENIVVLGSGPTTVAHLVDFGLAHSGALDARVRDTPAGTARYLAPEAAGLIEGGADARSDLYSLGLVLFECLAGRPAFTGETVGELLRQHLNTPAPHLDSAGAVVPRVVDAVIQRLLAKDPGQRYQSAGALLSDVTEITAALDRGISEPSITPGLHDRRQVLTEPAFVGRYEELTRLVEMLEGAGAAQRQLVFIEADSGGGKTRLLDELSAQAGRLGWAVFRGTGVDQAARRPFQMFDGVARDLVAQLAGRPLDAVAAVMGDRLGAAVATLPELAVAFGAEGSADGAGPEDFGEARSLEALAFLLDALGALGSPALVLLDDCQWADTLAVRLLSEWRSRGDGDCRVSVVAAFRSEEVGPHHPLRSVPTDATVTLSPLSPSEITLLCESMAGPLPTGVTKTVAQLADGSPFMAAAVLRGMVETGAIQPGRDGWVTVAPAMAEVSTSRRAAVVLARRFELLATPTITFLEVGAVLGKEFDLDLALDLTGQELSGLAGALQEARQRRIIWVDEATGKCSFAHDKLREALLARIAEDRRQALHLRAAELIEAVDPHRVFELAYHFDAAGLSQRALPYALEAAQRARARHALEVAADHYRIAEAALACAEGADARHQRATVAEGLGDVLTLAGSYQEAGAQLALALELSESRSARATIEGKLGNLAFKKGDQLAARAHLEKGLRELGRWVPRRGWSFALAAAFEAVAQILHSALPRLFVGRRSIEAAEADLAAARIYSRLAYVYWFHAGRAPCAWAHLREMNLVERYPPTLERAQAYSEHAPVMTMIPWAGRGIEYARRSFDIRRQHDDAWGQGQSLGFWAVVLYAVSRYNEAIERTQEAVVLLERTGDRWECHTAMWHQAYCLYRLGQLDRAVELARSIQRSASGIGDLTSAGISLGVWAKATNGAVPLELINSELARGSDDAHTRTELLVADGIRLLRAGDPEAAARRFAEAEELVRQRHLRQEYVAPVLAWWATALRTQLESAAGHAPRQARRRAARVARRAVRLARFYRNNLPHALREQALVASLGGRTRRAAKLLDRSARVAQSQGAAYEAALTVLAQASQRAAQGRPGSAAEVERA